MNRLFPKLSNEMLPLQKERHPLLFFEHAKIEVDGMGIKVISVDGNYYVPIAMVSTILFGTGVSITHDAIKLIGKANCLICWVGEESTLFYGFGMSPTHSVDNILHQAKTVSNEDNRTKAAQRLYSLRFPNTDLTNKSIPELMGMEGYRVRQAYTSLASQYQVDWRGRRYHTEDPLSDDRTNRLMTTCNQFLYGLITSFIWHSGYSPQMGIIHSNGSVPLVYDISDIYKIDVSAKIAFSLSNSTDIKNERRSVIDAFRQEILIQKIMDRIVKDINFVFRG